MDWRAAHRRTIVTFLVLAILIFGSGIVIFRNINKLSRLEYENQQRLLSAALWGFRREFTGVLLDLTRAFDLPFEAETPEDVKQQLIDRYQFLIEEESGLGLVSSVMLFVDSPKKPDTLFRLRFDEGVFVEEKPTPAILKNVYSASSLPGPRPGRGVARLEFVGGEFILTLPEGLPRRVFWRQRADAAQPFHYPFRPGLPPDRDRTQRKVGDGRMQEQYLVLLKLDMDYLESVFVRLTEEYFRRPLIQGFEVAVSSASDEKTIYESSMNSGPHFFFAADASIPLTAPGGWLGRFGFNLEPQVRLNRTMRPTGTIILAARHHLGSLEAAIRRQRSYDLLEAFGILLLLTVAAITLLLSLHRTRELARRQMDFVAGISHELKNPLTSIQSAGFNLSQGNVTEPEKIRKYGQIISKESRRLSRMVEQVLNYSGIQSSIKQYDWQLLQLEEILESVLQEYKTHFDDEAWNIDVNIEGDLPALRGDPDALKSCLRNLIDNSLKYADKEKLLRFNVNARDESGQRWVEVSVQDNGPGLSSSEISRIFEPFYRGAIHVASSKPGAGLGLALVKNHVEAHGGRIRVSGKREEGATFLLSFPAVPDTKGAPESNNGN